MSHNKKPRLKSLDAGLRTVAGQFRYLPATWRIIHTAAPRLGIVWLCLLLLQGLLPVGLVYLTRLVVDKLVIAVNAAGSFEKLVPVLILAGVAAAILLLGEVLQGASDWIRTAQSELIQDHINGLIHAKSTAVDLSFYESPDYHDRLYRVTRDASGRPLALLENMGTLLQNGLTLLGMAAILIPYGAWLPLILIGSTLPALYVIVRFNRRYHHWWEQTTPDRRWTDYYNLMLTNDAAAAELRLFGLGAPFQATYQLLRRRLRTERINMTREQSVARLGAGMLGLLVSGAAMAVMVLRALQGAATLGDLALFYQAFNSGQNLLRSLLSNVGQIYNNSLFLGNLFEFLALEPKVRDPLSPLAPPASLERGIRFRGITFRYPGSESAAIRDFDLTIPAGQIVAVVGPNGAGKSTLVKLLCRFYDVEAGGIELDGINIRDLRLEQLRRLITVLFQFPVPYHATAGENIAIADLSSSPSPAEIEYAARSAGAHEVIAELPKGYDTLLGKWFADGMELSAGEWQRVALARAYIRRAPIIVLDEPTSFMDSWAEADWFERLRALVDGRTAIVITHRFTIAMRADIIHVMDNGRIVESGSHAELIAQGGLYAQSWAAQMQASSGHPVPTPPEPSAGSSFVSARPSVIVETS